MAAPTSFNITFAYSTATAPWTGTGVWTVTAPWGFKVGPDIYQVTEQVFEKAGAQYGGRMQAYLANSAATNSTEVGTP